MKKLLIPLGLSLCVLLIIELTDIHSPIFFLSNEFYIESYQATNENTANTDIVIVNISDFKTDEIKDQIYILSQYGPSVIGVDYYLEDTVSSTQKENIRFNGIVLPILIMESDSIKYSKNPFSKQAHFGSIQIFSPSFFEPFATINEKKYPSFPVKMLQLYNSSLYEQLLKRNVEKEIINYSGNIENFIYLGDLTEIKTLDVLKEIKNKIVLVGYAGINSPYPNPSDKHDSHTTPKGEMFGVSILANILHTLMDNYITPISWIIMALITLMLTSFNILMTYAVSTVRFNYWIIKILQLVQLTIAFIVSSYIIHHFQMSLNYEIMVFTIVIAPELSYWYLKRKAI